MGTLSQREAAAEKLAALKIGEGGIADQRPRAASDRPALYLAP
jgi:hypothetical protein